MMARDAVCERLHDMVCAMLSAPDWRAGKSMSLEARLSYAADDVFHVIVRVQDHGTAAQSGNGVSQDPP